LDSTELQYLLTYGAEPFLRSCNCTAIQKIPSNFKEPEVHHRVHKSPELQYGSLVSFCEHDNEPSGLVE
jgi:hypothetical protein